MRNSLKIADPAFRRAAKGMHLADQVAVFGQFDPAGSRDAIVSQLNKLRKIIAVYCPVEELCICFECDLSNFVALKLSATKTLKQMLSVYDILRDMIDRSFIALCKNIFLLAKMVQYREELPFTM